MQEWMRAIILQLANIGYKSGAFLEVDSIIRKLHKCDKADQ